MRSSKLIPRSVWCLLSVSDTLPIGLPLRHCLWFSSTNLSSHSSDSNLPKEGREVTGFELLGESANRLSHDACSDLRHSVPRAQKNLNLRHLDQLRQFVILLRNRPETAAEAWKSNVVPTLRALTTCGLAEMEAQARMALSLLGYAPRYAGRGLRILSIDGGGTKGLIPLILLKELEKLCQFPVHRMFDYVCGTSTGSVVAALLFVKKSSIKDAETLYRDLSTKVFKMNNLLGISQLFLTHAFYDTKLLQKIIRSNEEAELLMYETTRDPEVPRLSIVSTLVSQPVIQPFLFSNYRHHHSNIECAHYLSACDVPGWEAMMASTAAPGYFEEVRIGSHVYQDGGLLSNNPCAIALHEARLLWGRDTPIQCIISLGTGLYSKNKSLEQTSGKRDTNTSLRDKLTKVVASATDTEAVHTILKDVLPPSGYYRFQPELTEDIAIDESDPEKLEQLVKDAQQYLYEQSDYVQQAVACLSAPKSPLQKFRDWTDRGWNKMRCRGL